MFRASFRLFRNSLGPESLRPARHFHLFTTRGRNKDASLTRRTAARLSVSTVLMASSIFLASTIYGDSASNEPEEAFRVHTRPTFGSLIRAYTVYSMCSVPVLVDTSPRILSVLSSIPGIRQITEAFVRVTFFNQFVGADTAENAIPLLHTLRAANRGVLFGYSVEVNESAAAGASISPSSTNEDGKPPHKPILDEILHCIDVAADFEAGIESKKANSSVRADSAASASAGRSATGRRTWVAVKVTALLPDAHALIAWSSHITASRNSLPSSSIGATVPFPGIARIEDMDVILHSPSPRPSLNYPSSSSPPLTPADIQHVRELYADLVSICTRAREKGIRVVVDAEYSWYQPAIDALTFSLMREFNSLNQKPSTGNGGLGGSASVQPLLYGTFQAYLRRTPAQLALALADARKHNYALGVKLVRGAYHPHEIAAHRDASSSAGSRSISPDPDPPVWTNKRDTDDTYNSCISVLVKAVKQDIDRCSSALASPVVPTENKGWFADFFGKYNPKRIASEGVEGHRAQSPLRSAPAIGVLFGTHNWDSCALILQELKRNGLAVDDSSRTIPGISAQPEHPMKVGEETVERVAIAQLYGMSDDLTEWVVSRVSCSTPFVIKYVPYGALSEVMPYLSRRAIENKSVLGDGAAHHERKMAGREIWKRILG